MNTKDRDSMRVSELAAIHVGKRKLALDDETYRALLMNLTGHESAKNLSGAQRCTVIDYMRKRGFAKAPGAGAGVHRIADNVPQAKMARGLWIELHKAGATRDSSERALNHFVKRSCGVDALAFCTVAQLNQVIEALKSWSERHAAKGGGKVVEVDFRGRRRMRRGDG